MTRVVIIDAGGTISSLPAGGGVFRGNNGHSSLLALLDEAMRRIVEVRPASIGLSEEMTLADARRVATLVSDAASEPATEAIVVAHGTDTMEEAAFLCDLVVDAGCPVIFTGAQRAPSLPGFDGAANLRDAIRVGMLPEARLFGTLVVFGGRILTADMTVKTDSQGIDAFGPDLAIIGRVSANGALITANPSVRGHLSCRTLDPHVDLLMLGLGSDHRLIEAVNREPGRGITVQALGQGNVPPPVFEALKEVLAVGRLVLVAAGTLRGGTGETYASAAALEASGALFAGELSARKARILLSCALGDERSTTEARTLLCDWLTKWRC